MRPQPPADGATVVIGNVLVVAIPLGPRQKACKAEKNPRVFMRYYGYDQDMVVANGGKKVWQAILFGRQTWEETCHVLGIYPCRIECLRRPESWPEDLPPTFDELTPDEVQQFVVARAEGRSLVSRYSQDPVPSRAKPPDLGAPQATIHFELGQRPVSNPTPPSAFGLPVIDPVTVQEVASAFGLPPLVLDDLGPGAGVEPARGCPVVDEPSLASDADPFGGLPQTEPSDPATFTRPTPPNLTPSADLEDAVQEAILWALEEYAKAPPTEEMQKLKPHVGDPELKVARFIDQQTIAINWANRARDRVQESGGSRASMRYAYDQVIERSGAWPDRYPKKMQQEPST
jgi:hypothetical protein